MIDENDRSKQNPNTKLPDLSLVLPCYNEEAVIYNTASRLIKALNGEIKLDLILVDNGSNDATGQIIDQMIAEGLPVTKVTVTVNQGYGNGILQGLKVCRARFVGYMCADGQVEASDVRKVYDIAANARSPYLVKVRRRFRMDGLTRKIVSIIYNGLTMALFGGLGSIDINGNPKIFPYEYLAPIEIYNQRTGSWTLRR